MDVQTVIFPGVVEEKRSLYWLSFLAPLWCVTRWQPNPMSVATYSHYLLSIFKACIFFWRAVGCWTWRLDIDGTILGANLCDTIYICIYLQIHRHIRHIYIYIYIYGLDVFVLLGTQFLCLPEVVWLFCPPPVVSLPAPWRRMWVRQLLFWQNFLRNLSVCRNRLWKRCWKAVGQNRSRSGMLQRTFGIASRRDWKMSSARTWRIGNLCCVICLRCFRWLSCPGSFRIPCVVLVNGFGDHCCYFVYSCGWQCCSGSL